MGFERKHLLGFSRDAEVADVRRIWGEVWETGVSK